MGALLDLAIGGATDLPSDSPSEVAAANHERQQRVDQATRMLAEVPDRRAAYIAGDERDGVIPITVVISTREGLVTGDLTIPKDRWDPWLFLKFLHEQDGQAVS
jgi:hypothetical protein